MSLFAGLMRLGRMIRALVSGLGKNRTDILRRKNPLIALSGPVSRGVAVLLQHAPPPCRTIPIIGSCKTMTRPFFKDFRTRNTLVITIFLNP
jgi:hypothetical protein